MRTTLVVSFSAALAATVLLWIIAMSVLQRCFLGAGKERESDEEARRKTRYYHNNAIYRNFEFFLKVALAVLGGIAYVTLQTGSKEQLVEKRAALLHAGGFVLLVAGALFSVAILTHQKSKIERWKKHFRVLEPLLWVETWMVGAIMGISVAVFQALVPGL